MKKTMFTPYVQAFPASPAPFSAVAQDIRIKIKAQSSIAQTTA